jgi:glycosyltransferase involved in cell wall biosynthesis
VTKVAPGVPGSPRVLHIHGSLAAGDPLALRCVQVVNAFGGRMRHSFVSGDGTWDALDGVEKGVPVERLTDFPSLAGMPLPGRLQKLAQAMADYRLVLTYGRAGVVAALAHTSFSELLRLPPLIHHEDGSDETPRQRKGLRSVWYRRIGLGKASGLVVPTELMEHEALIRWQQPFGRVKTIRDGADLAKLAKPAKPDAIPRLLKRPGERWIGCAACFDDGQNWDAWLAALGSTDDRWHLVLVGDGPGRSAIETRASARSLDNRVHFVAGLPDPETLIRLSDIVVIASGATPLPRAAIAAMAAGKPVLGMETGELAASLSEDNAPFIVGDPADLEAALTRLAPDDFLRKRVGEANRERAEAERDEKTMIATYRRLYSSAMGRETT